MAVYRADQAQVTFMTEPAAGGYVEISTPGNSTTTGNGAGTLAVDTPAGTRNVLVNCGSAVLIFEQGDFIEFMAIASGAVSKESEVRRVEHATPVGADPFPQTLTLDAPTGFYHPAATTATQIDSLVANSANVLIDQIPGVYETVDVPDPEQTIEGKWFLGTESKRSFFTAYSGQQTYAGSIGGFAILNGKALRYPIGTVSTSTTQTNDVTAMKKVTLASKRGDIFVTVTAVEDDVELAMGTLVEFGRGTISSEVRMTISGTMAPNGAGTIMLDYPLQFDHAAGFLHAVHTAGAVTTPALGSAAATPNVTDALPIPYTHAIKEAIELDSVTWNVHMRASNEDIESGIALDKTGNIGTATYDTFDFDRRYYGGKIGNASIAAEEGNMITMSWDSVNFLGMVHNQQLGRDNTPANVDLPFYTLMQPIRAADVQFPTTEPYYFSSGEVQMFGQTIARIRSFTLTINNNEEPRYYVSKQVGRRRGPTEIKEQRREYTLAVTLALPDATQSNVAARTVFNELLLEGNYGSPSDFIRTGKQGFNVILTLTRGVVVSPFEDKITITIPDDGAAGTGGNNQGAFIRTAPHNITEDNPFQVEADILFRNLKIDVQDAEHYYP